MNLLVKQDGRKVSELQFNKGPVSIGRQANSQVFLPNRAVSRQHAVIFDTPDGKWMVEDLASADKTYLNDKVVQKTEIKNGDSLRIADFTIEIKFDGDTVTGQPIHLEDTITDATRGPQIIVRKPGAEQAPPIRFPAKRAMDFLQATEAIGQAGTVDELVVALLSITLKQFDACRCWCALRNEFDGPMTCHAGKNRNGKTVELSSIKLNEKITQAVGQSQFLLFLFSRIPGQTQAGEMRTAMIAPILAPAGTLGVLYVDNAINDEHYSLSDLDYLMLLAVHAAARLRNL